MQKKIFWMVFMLLGLVADFVLPFWWACAATIPILCRMVGGLPERLVLGGEESVGEMEAAGESRS